MNTMPILFMHKKAEKIARRRARIATRVRSTNEQLLRPIRQGIKEERSTARKYRRQIRRCLDHLCVVVRIYFDNTLVRNFYNYFSKLRKVWYDLVDLDRPLRLDRLGNFLRICSNTIFLRQLRRHPLEFR